MSETIDRTKRTMIVTKSLPCILTDAERLQFGADLARESNLLQEAEDRKKAVGSQLKAEIEEHRAKANLKAALISAGYEYRDIECQEIWEYELGMVTIWRNDTGEVVSTRAMTKGEQQLHMDV